MDDADVELAKKWASLYVRKGFNPLPSRMDEKRPLVKFRRWWDTPVPPDLFDKFPTTNLQVMTGRQWRLLVIDLDGSEAKQRWSLLGKCPTTWATHSGGDGLHLWFLLPDNYPKPLPKRFLWKGEEGHSGIERLCDRSLIVVPPSIHPKTGIRYRFRSAWESPVKMPLPAMCPQWILDHAVIQPPRVEGVRMMPNPTPKSVADISTRYRFEDVLAVIPDKVALAESFGLRVVSRDPNEDGWCRCHAYGREDRNPSASISTISGWYYDFVNAESLSLFQLSVALGVYKDWREALSDLGKQYKAKESQ